MEKIKLARIFIFSAICLIAGHPLGVFGLSSGGCDYNLEVLQNCVDKEKEKCSSIMNDCLDRNNCHKGYVGYCNACGDDENKCWVEAGRVFEKYDKCQDKFEEVCHLETLFDDSIQHDEICLGMPLGSRFIKNCMANFNGLCKIAWTCDNDSGNNGKNKSSNDNSLSGGIKDNLGKSLVGLPVNSKISTVSCAGEAPKNSQICPKDDEKVFFYTQKELVESCSVPEGSERKCEYVCKGGYNFVDGECESVGFFARILNWFVNLF